MFFCGGGLVRGCQWGPQTPNDSNVPNDHNDPNDSNAPNDHKTLKKKKEKRKKQKHKILCISQLREISVAARQR